MFGVGHLAAALYFFEKDFKFNIALLGLMHNHNQVVDHGSEAVKL